MFESIVRVGCFRSLVLVGLVLLGSQFAAAESSDPPSAESWLGLPVSFESRGYALRPWPAVELRRVRIQSSQPIEIGTAWVTPDYAAWIVGRETRRLRVAADEIVASPAALARLGTNEGASRRVVSRISFERLKLRVGTGLLELPAGQMEFNRDGALAQIRMTLSDQFNLVITPQQGELAVLVQGGTLQWSALPAFRFESVVAQGQVSNDGIVLDRIGAAAAGGSVTGALRVTVSEKFVVDGTLKGSNLRAGEVLGRLYPGNTVEGTLSADFKLQAAGNSWNQLGESLLSASGSYVLKAGAIDRFGLLEGLRMSRSGVAGGGLLHFELASGRFSGAKGRPANVSVERLNAGALQATGNALVTQEGVLRGEVRGVLRKPDGELTSRTLGLAGRVDAPVLNVLVRGEE